jgi:hypothetical protein
MDTSSPWAFSENHRYEGSAAVQKYVVSSRLVTVPSSMTRPRSSHHGV